MTIMNEHHNASLSARKTRTDERRKVKSMKPAKRRCSYLSRGPSRKNGEALVGKGKNGNGEKGGGG